jgi:Ligase-CoA domain
VTRRAPQAVSGDDDGRGLVRGQLVAARPRFGVITSRGAGFGVSLWGAYAGHTYRAKSPIHQPVVATLVRNPEGEQTGERVHRHGVVARPCRRKKSVAVLGTAYRRSRAADPFGGE